MGVSDTAATGKSVGPPREFVPDWLHDASWSRPPGGCHGNTWLGTSPGGGRVLLKTEPQPGACRLVVEADGLRVLAEVGGLTTPEILDVCDRYLVLEALESRLPNDEAYWVTAARAVAHLHSHVGPRFGWPKDGWLGMLPQRNDSCEDGYAFYAQRRLLRYLDEPVVVEGLGPRLTDKLRRLSARLSHVLPSLPPVLTHGDMHPGNMLVADDRSPVFADPAVSWCWPTVDLSMMLFESTVPEVFFATYEQASGLDPSWRETAELLYLREILSTMAHPAGPEGLPLSLYAEFVKGVVEKFS